MNAQVHQLNLSPTAVICENLERFGGGPARGEPDTRAIWDHDEALAGLETILDTIVDDIAPDGTQFADERESLLWGFVNTLHMQTVRLDRTVDKLSPKLRELQSAQDGSEVQAWELERVIERAQHLGDRRDAFEQLRDAAAERYRFRHREHLAAEARLPHQPHGATDFGRDRRAGLPPGAGERENQGAPAAGHVGGRHRLQARRGRQPDLRRAGQRPHQVS